MCRPTSCTKAKCQTIPFTRDQSFVISICHYQLRQIAPNIFVLVTNICHSSCLTVTFAAVAPWLSFHLTLTHVH